MTSPSPHPAAAQPTLYWNLPDQDQARLQRDFKITDDEGYLAHDINWGRRLLDVTDTNYLNNPTPGVDTSWAPPKSPERFSDALAAILHVAVEAGLDPDDLANAALHTQRGVRNAAIDAASSR